ncbi:hypothetical protein T01_13702 [Trichinella spiralis]|uniref:Uncharacterized protein n=1 Tax=Trichinella spiralis TaxID=6334 RepID=A0A0V1A0C8_TRISP|nr:hypothetical protein T01_13702 [Trichinella spiralis]
MRVDKCKALWKQKKSDEQHQAEKLLQPLQVHSAVDIAYFDVSIGATEISINVDHQL